MNIQKITQERAYTLGEFAGELILLIECELGTFFIFKVVVFYESYG